MIEALHSSMIASLNSLDLSDNKDWLRSKVSAKMLTEFIKRQQSIKIIERIGGYIKLVISYNVHLGGTNSQ